MQTEKTQQHPEVKKIIELMKANAKSFKYKDTLELYRAAEELYWDSYYKALGYNNEEEFYEARGTQTQGQTQINYYGNQTGYLTQIDNNKVNPEFANIAKEAKEKSADDEKAIEEMKKKHLKK